MGPAGGLAVIATEYPYDVLAGLALGTFEDGRYAAIESTAAPAVVDLLAVEIPLVSGDGNFTLESFRRGRLGYQIMAFGDDASEREALASQAAVAAAALAPPGASAPIQPPSAARSIVQAVVATALVIVGALAIRRLLAGRARRLAPVAPPAPILVDVSRDAATLRRDGRRLATLQIAACAVVVVGLVADVGWWWVLVVAVGVAIGLAATARARRRELARSPGRWSLPSARTSLLGLVGALLVLVGVACAVRGLKEWVLLPSLTHLRLADRVGVSPDRLAAAMAVAGIVALVLAAVVLRRGTRPRPFRSQAGRRGRAG